MGERLMERLKRFLTTRLLLLIAGIMAAEAVCGLLVRRVLLPYAATIAQYGEDTRIISFGVGKRNISRKNMEKMA